MKPQSTNLENTKFETEVWSTGKTVWVNLKSYPLNRDRDQQNTRNVLGNF